MIDKLLARTSPAALGAALAVVVACAPSTAPANRAPAPAAAPAAPSASQAAPPAASAPASATAPAASGQAAWQAEWERVVAAAKQEGRVVVTGPPGDTARQALTAFQQAYPDIQLDYTGARGADFISRTLSERRADRFLVDVLVSGTGGIIGDLLPAGAVDPLKPALIRPEVLDDSHWYNGFDFGFVDLGRQYVFSFASYVSWAVYVNRDVVPEAEFTRFDDLLDPKWRGKISINEPRDSSAGAMHSVVIMQRLGTDAYRKLLTEQDVSVHQDTRQQVELLVRGSRPIGIGVSQGPLLEFQRQGIGRNVRALERPEASALTGGFGGCACLMNRAPHPNAARVYLDWLLSREGQTAWNQSYPANSRRLDVEPYDPATLPKPGVDYLFVEREEVRPMRDEQFQMARDLIR
jgi:iron(III) transport system substrate-binding protein